VIDISATNHGRLPEELRTRAAGYKDAFAGAGSAVSRQVGLSSLPAIDFVWGISDFVAHNCVRNPEILLSLVKTGDLQRSYGRNDYRERLSGCVSPVVEEEDLGRRLRLFRQREMVRIAWRDLGGMADVCETMADLSGLAEVCLEQALAKLYQWQCLESGVPCGKNGEAQPLVVLGMGKLGARELNFSSDIDLVFAYPEAGDTRHGSKTVTNEEFFKQLARRLIKTIGNLTAEGFVFRVDMRLRPYGNNGPLVMSFAAMEEYYQLLGREWERYAWVKARVAAGGKPAGERLLLALRPFVYRRYLDFGVFEALRDMKQLIAREAAGKGLEDNIKLGPGGIREVEFIGQAFQLLRGGQVPALQEQSILKVLKLLDGYGYLPQKVSRELLQAYLFLRRTEHRLQEFNDQQTHNLPREEDSRTRLAFSLGYGDWQSFERVLRRHLGKVHADFNKLFDAGRSARGKNPPASPGLQDLWRQRLDDGQAHVLLAGVGFDDPQQVRLLLADFESSRHVRSLSQKGRGHLDRLMPQLLKSTAAADQPFLVLRRLIALLEAIMQRTAYLALLNENPAVLVHLVNLVAASPKIEIILAHHPVLLDELLDPRTLYNPPNRAALVLEMQKRLQRLPADDLELQMEELRNFRQANFLRVAAADVTKALSIMEVSDHLTFIAEAVVNQVLELARHYVVESRGKPSCCVEGRPCDAGFAVIAYGKFGGMELGYGSDLDLVFLRADSRAAQNSDRDTGDIGLFYNRLGRRFIHILTAKTAGGLLFPVDMRLRPDGASGPLMSTVPAFAEYQLTKAWVWEHQALVRARPVAGDPIIAARFSEIRRRALAICRDPLELRQQVSDMRHRLYAENKKSPAGMFDLKNDAGGIVDIEFIVQYIVLRAAHKYPELLRWTDNFRLLETIAEIGILQKGQAALLREAYLAFRTAVHSLSLQEKPALVDSGNFNKLRGEVREVWRDLFENK